MTKPGNPLRTLAWAEMYVSTFINNRDKQNAELAEKRSCMMRGWLVQFPSTTRGTQ